LFTASIGVLALARTNQSPNGKPVSDLKLDIQQLTARLVRFQPMTRSAAPGKIVLRPDVEASWYYGRYGEAGIALIMLVRIREPGKVLISARQYQRTARENLFASALLPE
jgi:hypothetical protein